MPSPAQRMTLVFEDPELERAYRRSGAVRWSTFVKGTLVLALVWAAMISWCAVIAPGDVPVVAKAILLCVVPAVVLALISTRVAPAAIRERTVAIAGPLSSFGAGIALVVIRFSVADPALAAYAEAGLAVTLITFQVFVNGLFVHKVWLSAAMILLWTSTRIASGTADARAVTTDAFWIGTGLVLGMYISFTNERLLRRVFLQRRQIEEEQAKSDRLLRNMLPESIAARLKQDAKAIADGFDAVTVLFADIVGFTPLAATLSPARLVELLNEIFSAFDALALEHGMEKIKTIGDAYMVVSGLPKPRADHAVAAAAMALGMRDTIARFGGGTLALRIGLHSGPVVAGVIGTSKYSYDLWGDTVNTASRMESHGAAGEIHLSDACRQALGVAFAVEERGLVEIKGKGPLRTWWLRTRLEL